MALLAALLMVLGLTSGLSTATAASGKDTGKRRPSRP